MENIALFFSLILPRKILYICLLKKIVYLFNECVKMTKELYLADTLVNIKYTKTIKTVPLCLYTALDESLVTNIALRFYKYLQQVLCIAFKH